VPALVLTFFFGPAGLLVYLAIRWFAPARGALERLPAIENAE
jgi:hypothetical protein